MSQRWYSIFCATGAWRVNRSGAWGLIIQNWLLRRLFPNIFDNSHNHDFRRNKTFVLNLTKIQVQTNMASGVPLDSFGVNVKIQMFSNHISTPKVLNRFFACRLANSDVLHCSGALSLYFYFLLVAPYVSCLVIFPGWFYWRPKSTCQIIQEVSKVKYRWPIYRWSWEIGTDENGRFCGSDFYSSRFI